MSDITKCPGLGCPIRDECYRYTAPPGKRQSWFMMTPGYYTQSVYEHVEHWDCDKYLPVKWEPTGGRNGSADEVLDELVREAQERGEYG